MKRILILFIVLISVSTNAQTVLGKWKTIDDETGEPKSIVEISERGGKVYGKIVKLFRKPNEDQDPVCDDCDPEDPRYKKKIIGMEIMKDLVKDDDEYSGGEILDPNNGKVYRCKIWIEGKDLMLRGYIGPFYRTQTWIREK
jgi:uncharacterized protein (DUF2147 family)